MEKQTKPMQTKTPGTGSIPPSAFEDHVRQNWPMCMDASLLLMRESK